MTQPTIRRTPEKIVARKRDSLEDKIHRSVAAYVEYLGGSVVVSGPLQIQQWPGDGEFKFTVALKCAGRKPRVGIEPPKPGEK